MTKYTCTFWVNLGFDLSVFVLFSRFDVPIAFQQTNRPVPLEYTLNTHFQITNNEKMFVMDPFTEGFDMEDMDSDTHIAFSKGNLSGFLCHVFKVN
jgi:hypothetical protein